MKNILILTSIPAPYRCEVFDLLSKEYNVTVFYERNTDTERNEQWFISNNVNILDNTQSVSSYKRSIRHLKAFDFVFLYEYSTKLAIQLMLHCILNKVPYAINCDGAFISDHWIKNAIKRFFIKRAALCLASGKSAANYFKHLGATEDKIVYHGFTSLFKKDILLSAPSKETKQALRKERNMPDGICAIAVGRFIKSKAFDVLISAWHTVPSEYTLLLVGGGSERSNYEQQIAELGLSNIKIYDYLPFDELIKYYQACDFFVLPTLTDVWGLVVNEAMANGLPVITTDMCIAGLELIEDHKNGYIVPIHDVAALATAVIKIAGNEDLRNEMALNNIKKIAEYTYENIAQSHINALKDWENSHVK